MKVVHVEAGRHLYGGALQVVFLLEGLQSRGIESVLVCPPGAEVGRRARELGIDVREIPLRGDHDLPFIARLVRLLRRERPDILHLHSRRGADTLGGIAGRLAGVPTVLSRRVDNPEPRWLVAVKYRLYDRVVTISRAIGHVLRQEGVPAHKVDCVPSAVDTDRYHPDAGDRATAFRELQVPPDALPVAVVAQFIPRKGHRVALQAAFQLKQSHPRLYWIFFGQGPLEAELRAETRRLGLESRVIFPGFRNDLEEFLPHMALLVHPAFMEGLGVSLLQAAACGVPIVASAVGGVPEIMTGGAVGRTVTPGNPPELAFAIAAVVCDTRLREEARADARGRIRQNFSIDAMVAGNIACYEQLDLDTDAQ